MQGRVSACSRPILLTPALRSPLSPGSCFVAPALEDRRGVRSGQMPSISLGHALPPQFLQGPLGAQHISLDFIRIKEMSHICKQALLQPISPTAVQKVEAAWKDPVWPPSRADRLFL